MRFRDELDDIENNSEYGTKGLTEKGKINGRMDMPPHDFEGLDTEELSAAQVYERLVLAKIAGYMGEHAELVWKLDPIDRKLFPDYETATTPLPEKSDKNQPDVIQHACSRMDTVVAKNTEQILKSRENARQARDEYQAFMEKNGLTYHMDDSEIFLSDKRFWKKQTFWSKVGWWALLVVSVGVESYINRRFFEGQVGGLGDEMWRQAILISVVNIGLFGSLLMLSRKYLFHAQKNLRAWAWTGFIFFCLFALIYNLGVAHFRDALPQDFPSTEHICYEAGSESPAHRIAGKEAICLLGNNFVRLGEFQAYSFFLLGLGFILLGTIDWGHIFFGYPGYINARRRFLKAQRALDTDCESTSEEIQKIYDEAAKDLKSSILNGHKFAFSVIRLLDEKNKDMRAYIDEIAQRCGRALEFYRTANRLAREDISHIPANWDKDWEHDWNLEPLDPPGDLGLCNSEYAQSLYDKEQQSLELHYRASLKKVHALAIFPDEDVHPDA